MNTCYNGKISTKKLDSTSTQSYAFVFENRNTNNEYETFFF